MEHNIISVSGGKDSTALLLLAIEHQPENMQAVFCDTGHEHAQTYDYILYLEQATGIPIRWVKADFSAQIEAKRARLEAVARGDKVPRNTWTPEQAARAARYCVPTGNPFADLCIWKGRFPSTKARFCSEELKRNVIQAQVNQPLWDAGAYIVSWQGVRADESPSRALLDEEEDVNQQYTIYRPLLRWTAADCFAMHKKHGIRHNPLYEQGMGRVGCMPCIHASKNELREIAIRFPEEIDRVEEMERVVGMASRRNTSSFFASDKTPGDHVGCAGIPMPNIRDVVEWSKTGRGGRQFDWLRMEEDGLLCSSMYGLCE